MSEIRDFFSKLQPKQGRKSDFLIAEFITFHLSALYQIRISDGTNTR